MKNIIEIFKNIDAFLDNDHFVYSSGKHGEIYINKNDLFANPEVMSEAGSLLAQKAKDKDIDTVAGPAICGILPAHWTAFHLSKIKNNKINTVFGEHAGNKEFEIKRGYKKYIENKRVLLVDDITTSGGTIKRFGKTIDDLGGKVVGALVLINRSPNSVTSNSLGFPLESLGEIEIATWEANQCPLCEKNVPVNTQVGHGKKFVSCQ